MSWEDEIDELEFDPKSVSNANFDDEEEVLDDWEAESDGEEKPAEPKGPTRNRVGAAQRIQEREEKEREVLEKKALEAAEEDEATKRERLRKIQLESDLNNAASLFGQIDVHPRAGALQKEKDLEQERAAGPAKLSDLAIFKAKTKADLDTLRKTLVPLLTDLHELAGPTQHANFVVELVRDVCKPLPQDQIRKASSTLNAVIAEKQREERANRGKKKKPAVKASSLKVDENKDTTNFDDYEDDVDFM